MTTEAADRIHDPARLAAVRETGLLDTDPEAAFDDLARMAATLLEAPYAFITLVDDRRSFWKSRIGLGSDPAAAFQNTVEESFCQYVIGSGEPLIIGNTAADPLTAGNPSIASMGVAAWAGFPLMGPDGHVLGSFCVVDVVVRTWHERDVDVLRVLSRAAAREIALRSAYAKMSLAARQRDEAHARLQLLADVSQAVFETLEVTEAVGRLAQLVVPVLGDWSIVSILESDGVTMRDVGWWHVDESRRPLLDEFAGERFVGLPGHDDTCDARRCSKPSVVESGALEVGQALLQSESARRAYAALAPGSFTVFPLVAAGTVIGTMAVMRDADRPAMTAADLEVGTGIAHRTGMALENARLYAQQSLISKRLGKANERLRQALRHDRVVARALQDAMLTRLPEPDHVHLVARYLTADGADQVGGDWYDAVITSDGALTLMIGDVAGHDIGAATVMGQLRNLLRGFAWNDPSEPPSGLIARLDRAMTDLGITTMTTLAVLRIEQDPADRQRGLRTLRWSSAGHVPVILVSPDGLPSTLVGEPDRPLGVEPAGARRDYTCPITPGGTLFLYTDGLIETRALDLAARQSELLDVLETAAGFTPDDLLDTVLTTMVGEQPADDVALLAARFHSEDQPRPAEAGPEDNSNHP